MSSTTSHPKSHSLLFRGLIWLHVRLALAKKPEWHRNTLQTFRDSLGGGLPKPGTGGVILAACNDLYYNDFAGSLLCSLEKQHHKQRVHLHLYEPGAETLAHIERLRLAFTHIELSYTVDPCLLAKDQPYPIMYYASARFLMASLILEEVGSPVLCIDVDAMANQPVWLAYESWRAKGDVGLIFRDKAKLPWRRILASAVGFNATAGGKRYCSTVARGPAVPVALQTALSPRPDCAALRRASHPRRRQNIIF